MLIASVMFAASLDTPTLLATPALAESITGPATVTDGDTIKIDGHRIRIHGIDAFEQKQPCTYTNGDEWPCGSVATAFMSHLVANQSVTCEQRDLGRYGRIAKA
jgi:endonuclease YncB( thermonuclease family)